MKRSGFLFVLLFALLMFLPAAVYAEGTEAAAPEYSNQSSWAYFADGEDTGVDVFLLCPTVDYNDELNATLDDEMKAKFNTGISMEKGVYDGAGRIYAPYYRQMAMTAYKYAFAEDKTQYVQAMNLAYSDVSKAFRYYLEHENKGRGIILAGFSQGSQMCLELLKEYYGGDSKEAVTLRKNLVSVYAIGWRLSEDTVDKYPQIIPAAGEDDFGSVVSYDCENGELAGTMIIPAGTKALSINPLNWKTDGTEADRSLHRGALMLTTKEIVPGFCGARIGSRGELIATGVNADEFPPTIGGVKSDFFPKGHFHVYDYSFFFVNLKQNVITRSGAWRNANRSKITVDVGLAQVASGWKEFLNGKDGIPGCNATVSEHTVTLFYPMDGVTVADVQKVLSEKLLNYMVSEDALTNEYMKILKPNAIGQKKITEYNSGAEVAAEVAGNSVPLSSEQKFYTLWADKPVSSFDVAIETPVCGTKTTAALKVKISDEHVLLTDLGENNWFDDQDQPFNGTFKGGKTYWTVSALEPALTYYFPKDLKIKLTGGALLPGDDKPYAVVDGMTLLFHTRFTAEHNWDEGMITTPPSTEKAGVKTFTCKGCGATRTEVIEKLSPVNPVNPVNPTAKEVLDKKLPKIAITKPAAGKKSFTAKWKKLSKKNSKKAAGIEIQYARNKKFTASVKLVKAKATAGSKKISKLAKKKTYYLRIRTYRKVGGVKHFGKWSKAMKVMTR